jgi:hypothetical protein
MDSFHGTGKTDALYQLYQLHECVGSSKKSQSNQSLVVTPTQLAVQMGQVLTI